MVWLGLTPPPPIILPELPPCLLSSLLLHLSPPLAPSSHYLRLPLIPLSVIIFTSFANASFKTREERQRTRSTIPSRRTLKTLMKREYLKSSPGPLLGGLLFGDDTDS